MDISPGGFNKMKMNKVIVMSVFALLAVCLAPIMVSAGSLSLDTNYSSTVPTFGDDGFEASNSQHDDDEDQVVNDTASISLSNDLGSDFNITGITLSDAKFGLTPADFDFTNAIGVQIVNGTTPTSISIMATIPENLDAVDTDYNAVAMYVGELTIDATNATGSATSIIFDIYMQRENKLVIDDLDALINNKDSESNIENDDDIKDLGPTDVIDFSIVLESMFKSKDNIDIEDVELEITCDEDSELEFSPDDLIDIGDMGTKDTVDEEITIEIDESADSVDSTTCYLTVSGTDENGALHGEEIFFNLDIDRESHNIVIRDVRISPTALTCDDSSFQVSVDMLNLGDKDEDEVAVQIQSVALGITEKLTNLVMDQDDKSTETFILPVNTEDLTDDTYALLVTTFYDTTRQTDSTIVQLENLCNADADSSDDSTESDDSVYTDAITLDQDTITTTSGKLVSIKVQLTNDGNSPVDYVVSLEDLEDFASSTSNKNVHLNPGQTSTVFLNMKANDDVEDGAMYTASVVVKDSNTGSILETETFTVEVGNDAGASFEMNSKLPLTVLNIVLVIVAAFLIKLIFSGKRRKKASTKKKMADFDSNHSVVLKKKK
jgi:hypothetical protein